MTTEALKLALEALITASGHVNNETFVKVMMARDSVVEALAQPEQQNCKDGSCDCCWTQPEQGLYSEDELVKARKWAEETAKVLNEPEQKPVPLYIEDDYVRNYLWERALIATDDLCTRSHPHEDMNDYCHHKTVLARMEITRKKPNDNTTN